MSEDPKDHDVMLLHSATEDGGGLNVVRLREGSVSTGTVRPAAPGKPVNGELVRLRPRDGQPALCDVEVLYSPPAATAKSAPQAREPAGPAQVATRAYRDNWDKTFGASSDTGTRDETPEDRTLN